MAGDTDQSFHSHLATGLPGHGVAVAMSSRDLCPGVTVAEAARLSLALRPCPAGHIHAVVGGAERVKYERQSRAIAEAWDGTWESVAGANHFSLIGPLVEPGSALTQCTVQMPRAILNRVSLS